MQAIYIFLLKRQAYLQVKWLQFMYYSLTMVTKIDKYEENYW